MLPLQLWNSPSASFSTDPKGTSEQAVQIQSQTVLTNTQKSFADVVKRLSRIEYYLDPSTYLLQSIRYNTHPDNNLNFNIPVEVRYSQYQLVNGVQVPFKIQKYLNGSLILQISVSRATINPTIADSEFQTQR